MEPATYRAGEIRSRMRNPSFYRRAATQPRASRTLEDCDGKGVQLLLDAADFPALAGTGLHSESELDRTKRITGRPVEQITNLGRPRGLSWEGFLAPDGDVVSVMKRDNRLVSNLGLTHPQLARPLFHVLNAVLSDTQLHATVRQAGMGAVFYNGKKALIDAMGTRGGQKSIFDEGITGASHILGSGWHDQRMLMRTGLATLPSTVSMTSTSPRPSKLRGSSTLT